MFISVIYFAYILLWGLNYHRLSFANIASLTVQPATTEELASVCNSLIDLTNRLRTGLNENQNGVMIFPSGKASILMGAAAGYEQAGIIYPELQGRYGSPKGVLLSEPMSYLGLAGIYFPFTGEANVNMAVPDAMLPSAICHEMAHQRGFAREDEANYIAYLTCRLNPDPYFQYSGNLLALIVSMNTLNQYNPERYLELQAKYDPGIKKDLEYYALFWRNHETKLGDISNVANDLYLKSNHQLDGVYSYNRMINLLIAEYRSNGYI